MFKENKSKMILALFFYLALVPLIGAFIVLGMLACDGTKGINKFGPKPKK